MSPLRLFRRTAPGHGEMAGPPLSEVRPIRQPLVSPRRSGTPRRSAAAPAGPESSCSRRKPFFFPSPGLMTVGRDHCNEFIIRLLIMDGRECDFRATRRLPRASEASREPGTGAAGAAVVRMITSAAAPVRLTLDVTVDLGRIEVREPAYHASAVSHAQVRRVLKDGGAADR